MAFGTISRQRDSFARCAKELPQVLPDGLGIRSRDDVSSTISNWRNGFVYKND